MMESCQEIEGGDMADEAHVTLLKDMHSQLNSILVRSDNLDATVISEANTVVVYELAEVVVLCAAGGR
jgi:hypothetical protein